MKKTIVLAALLLASIAASAASIKHDFAREITAQCAALWPGNSTRRARCVNKQTAAALAVIRSFRAAKASQRRLIAACLDDWQQDPIAAAESYNYTRVRWCVRGMAAAHRASK